MPALIQAPGQLGQRARERIGKGLLLGGTLITSERLLGTASPHLQGGDHKTLLQQAGEQLPVSGAANG